MKKIPIQSSTFNTDPFVLGKVTKVQKKEHEFTYRLKFHKNHRLANGIITNAVQKTGKNVLFLETDPLLQKGDILEATESSLFLHIRNGSSDNALVVNNHCNLRCINCPQETLEHVHSLHEKNHMIIDLMGRTEEVIALTGGEPTLDIAYLTSLMVRLRKKNKKSRFHILTNGIALTNEESVQILAECIEDGDQIAVSLYADLPEIHDQLTQVPGTFWKTVRAIHTLAAWGLAIEIRFVINKLNYQRLPYVIEFLYDHFPYVHHVTLMGMEYSGSARTNGQMLFISQREYAPLLQTAVMKGKQRNMHVSLYNHQLCMLPRELWKYCVPSISRWKESYLPECSRCDLKGYCGGFFATSDLAYREYDVQPIDLSVHQEVEV